MTLTEILVLVFLAIGTIFCVFLSVPVGMIIIGLTLIVGAYSLKKIEADPPTMAINEVLGKPQETLIQPRYVLVCEPLEELILLPGGAVILEFTFGSVSCGIKGQAGASGGFVTVMLTVIGHVTKDAKKAYDFVSAGREAGVTVILNDRLEQAVREHGAITDWETFRAEKKGLGVRLDQQVKQEAASSGLTAIGFVVDQVLAKSIEPEGTLKEDAQNLAREVQQRRTEEMDIDTGVKLVQKYQAANPGMSFEQAATEVRKRRNPNTTEVIVVGLEANPLGGFGALSNPGLFGKKGGKS